MLSAETASGKYPREAVAIMVKIVLEAEAAKEIRATPRRLTGTCRFPRPSANPWRMPRTNST